MGTMIGGILQPAGGGRASRAGVGGVGAVGGAVVAVVVAWFAAMVAVSWMGGFDSVGRPPALLGIAAVVPVVVFAVLLRRVSVFRELVLGVEERWLTLAHTWRVGGIVFLILWAKGLLPGVFAFPAGMGDMAIGITAPLMAWGMSRGKPWPRGMRVGWHLAGLADLVAAVGLGVLTSVSPIGVLASGVPTREMGLFPMSLVPTFFVPLLVMLHLAALAKMSRGGERA